MGELVTAARGLLTRALAPRATMPEYTTTAGVLYSPENRAQKTNVDQWRAWARWSPWIRAAVNIRKEQIASADYEIGPFDIDKPYSKRLAKQIKSIFDFPNPRERSFRAFATKVMDDLMTLDAGVFEIVGSLMEPVRYVYPVDAKFVRVAREWDGIESDAARYFWYPDGQLRGSWKNTEMGYVMVNSTTYNPLGIPPPETLKISIDTLLSGNDYNRRQMLGAAPDGLLHLGEGVPPDKVESFKSDWAAFQMQGGALSVIGGGKNPSYTSFRDSNRDMQFTEFMRFMVTEIAIVYMLSIQDFQQLFDINRSTGETQAELTEDRGLRPLADLLQDEFTQQIVWHPSFGGPDNNLAFRFTKLKIKESYERARTHDLALAHFPKNTVNEARVDDGREPIGDINDEDNPFNQMLANTSQGLVRIPRDAASIPTPMELLESKKPETPTGTADQPSAARKPKSPVAAATDGPSEEN